MQVIKYPPKETWDNIIQRPTRSLEDIEEVVGQILAEVKSRGDEALSYYNKKFDGL